MRKLMWIAIGLVAASAIGAYLLPVQILLWLGAGALFLCVGSFLLLRKSENTFPAFLLLGLALGFTWFSLYDGFRLKDARKLDGETLTVTITVSDYSFEANYGTGADGTVELNGKNYAVRFYLNQKVSLSPGDSVFGEYRFRYTADGGREEATHHSSKGILLLAYPQGDPEISFSDSSSVRYFPSYLRKHLLETVEKVFPDDAAPFVKALLLSDTSELNYETETALSLSGIRHVAAVSGLHVSMLFSLVYLLTGKRRILTAAVGAPVLLLFAAMAGFTPSVVRACTMQLLMLLAMVSKREYDPPTALSFAVVVMLLWNPLVITSTGFQLSVASVAGIFLFAGRISTWLLDQKRLGRFSASSWKARLMRYISASISVSISAMVTTLPLCAWYFGCISLLSVLTNLLCLWVITVLFCGVIVACILCFAWLPLARMLGWILAWAVRYVLGVAGAVAELPFAAVYTESIYIVCWLAFCYVLLCVFLLSKERRPLILSCCAAIALMVSLIASWTEPILDNYRVTVLDVGQGQCILLQSDGKTYMVDCGGGHDETTADKAAAALLSQGVETLDGLILTHYDKDHVGAVQYLLSRVDADVLIVPEDDGEEDWVQDLCKEFDGQMICADENLRISWEDSVITVFTSQLRTNHNESSLCVLFQTEKCDILITGDRSTVGEEELLSTTQLPQLDVLVLGHHGARNSTGEALLEATKPEYAVISVGAGNAYGHPSEETIRRCAAFGCKVRRTDLEGTILFRG